jgi:hypothetical protein
MPAGFGGVKTKGRPLEEMAHLKRSIVHVNAEKNCLAHGLIIAIALVDNDPNYNSNRKGWKIRAEVHRLQQATGVDLFQVGEFLNLKAFSSIFTTDTRSGCISD